MENKAKSIVFIDAGIEAPLQLASGIDFDAEIIILSSLFDGVTQITVALKSHPDAVKMAIVGHGAPGQMSLGNAELSLATLPQYRDRLQQWTAATQITEIAFYGCRVAAGDAGTEFLAAVRSLTGANIAASTHLLGHADQGGDWTLDAFWGEVARRSLLTPAAIAAYSGVLASANDNIESDVVLTPNTSATGDNSGATAQTGEPLHDPTLVGAPAAFQNAANDSLWWSWTANIDGLVNVNTAGDGVTPDSAIDTVLAVYQSPVADATAADFAGFTLIGRNDNASTGVETSSVTFNAVNGVTYYFAVDGVGLQQTTGNGITITLNTPPIIAAGQLFSVPEDGSAAPNDGTDSVVNASGAPTTWSITSGNPDTDGDNFKAFAIDSTGTLSVADADELDFETTTNYQLTVKATDASGFSDTESVFVQVTNVNEAPEIVSITAPSSTNEGQSITLTGQISDPDNGDTQTVLITWGDGTNTTVNNGSLVSGSNGVKTFTVNHIYTDDETVTGPIEVSVTDSGGKNDGPVSRQISVLNVAPEINPGGPLSFTIDEDDSQPIFVSASDVSSADTFTWSVGEPTNGTVNDPTNPAATSQLFTYTPDANFAGNDSFEIQVTDDDGGTDTVTVNITVEEQPDSPTGLNVTASTDTISEGESITLSGSFADPDVDDEFTITIDWGDGTTEQLTNADLATGANGTYTFSGIEHTFASNGNTTIFVTVEDSDGLTSTDSTAITVNNLAPTLSSPNGEGSTFIEINEDDAGSITLTASDAGDDTFTWSIKTNGTDGTAALVSPGTDEVQEFSYTPDADFFGSDNFVVQVQDGDGGTNTANVTVFINPVNDAPTNLTVNVNPTTALNEGSEVTLSGTFDDVDNSTEEFLDDIHSITVDWGDGTAPETFTDDDVALFVNTDQKTVTFQDLKHIYADEGDGTYDVTIVVKDADGLEASLTEQISVLNVDPVIDTVISNATPLTTDEDTAVDFTVAATDVGLEDVLTWSEIVSPTNGFLTPGAVTSNGIQTFTYTPNRNFDGSDTFTLQVADGDGGFADKTYTVNITAQNDAPTITANNFNIVEDQVLPITLSVLDAQDLDEAGGDAAIKFTITGAAAGSFLVDSGTGPVASNVFTRQDIIDEKVTFLYENTTNTDPTFTIKVEDSATAFTTVSAEIKSFQSVDDDPVFVDQDTVTAGTQLGTFTVPEGGSVQITNAVIKVTDEETSDRDLSFTVSDVGGGQFLLNGEETTEFTQGDIDDGLVRFQNDDTEVAPSYTIAVEDSGGNQVSLDGTGTVATVNDAPTITKNEFNVTEGESLTITSAVLNASDAETFDSSKITFTISGDDKDSFRINNGAGPVALTGNQFTLQDVFNGSVTFLYDENDTPVFDITVADEQGKSVTVAGNVIFTDENDAPTFKTGPVTFDIAEGGSTLITPTILEAEDEESSPANLTFTVSNVQGGSFIVAGEAQTIFTQQQINNNAVFFQQDQSETAPSYDIFVTDGGGLKSETLPGAGNINAPVNDLPTLDVNNFNVTEGVAFTVDTNVLNASDDETTDSAQITFNITGDDAGSFSTTTFTLQDVFAGTVTFLYEGNDEPEFDITVTDGDTGSITVAGNIETFNATNDAPTFKTGPVAFDVAEGGNKLITAAILEAEDEESSPADLTFEVSNLAGGDFFVGGQKTTTFTQQQVNANAVFFKHDGSETAPSYSIKIKDGEDLESEQVTGTGTINPTVNDAPEISINNFTVQEGVELDVTSAVLDATDVDSTTEILFTIGGHDAGSFLVNGNPSPTFTRAQILAEEVTFLYTGETTPVFTITASDQDTGAPGGAAQVTVNGNVTFEEANDTPVFLRPDGLGGFEEVTDGILPTFEVDENGNFPITANIIKATDGDADDRDLVFTITAAAGGNFFVSSGDNAGNPATTFTQNDINLGRVFFANDRTETPPSYTIVVTDSEDETLTSTATGSGTVDDINDRPVFAVNNFNVVEGQVLNVDAAVLNVTDEETLNSANLTFTISGTNKDSFLIDNGAGPVALTGDQFTLQDVFEGKITFLYEGETAPVFDIKVEDDGLNTGAASSRTVAGNVATFTTQNDAPTFVDQDTGTAGVQLGDITLTEDGQTPITSSIIAAVDPDNSDSELTFTVEGVTAAEDIAGGFFTVKGVQQSTFTQQDISQGTVFFKSDGTEADPAYKITVSDGELSATAIGGGTTIANDDAPTLAANDFAITEGVELTITTDILDAQDIDTDDANIQFTIGGTNAGSFLLSGNPSTTFSRQDIVEGNVTFLYEDQAAPAFTITVTDGTTPLPTVDAAIDFTAVNDAPTLTITPPITITEDAAIAITSTLFAVTDEEVDSGFQPASDLEYTVVAGSLQNGKFLLNGSETSSFTQQDIIDNLVDFQHEGEAAPSFTLELEDNGTPVNEQVTRILTAIDFNFTPANDVPVLGNTSLEITEGGTVTLKTSNLSATDVETNALDLRFELTNVQNGEFSIDGGTTFVAGDLTVANGRAFTLEDIIQTQVVFKHDDTGETPTDNKAPSFDVNVIDLGTDAGLTSPADDASSAVVPVTITFNAVDDAPVLTPDGDKPGNLGSDPFGITEGGILILNDPADSFPGIQVTDPDTPPEAIIITPANLSGGFFANASDTETAISSFTLAELNAQQIVFNHDGSESQPSFTLRVKDDAAAEVNDDVQNYTATLTSSNDAPEIQVNTLTLTEDAAVPLTTADLQVTDQETGPAAITYTVTNLTNGNFFDAATTDFDTATPLTNFTQQDVIDGNVVFKHDGSNDAPTYTLTAADDGTGSPTITAANSAPSDAVINFTPENDAPVDNSTTKGVFTIEQGSTFAITTNELSFTDEETTNPALLIYEVDADNTKRGEFLVDGSPVTQFTQQDINFNRVSFRHDGSEFAPSYVVTVSDHGVPAPGQSTVLEVDLSGSNFINNNNAPILSKNELTISEGETVELNTSFLSASDSETRNLDLVFTISDIKNGQFIIADNPATTGIDESATFGEFPFTADNTPVAGGTTAESFTLRDVVEGRVSFAHDGFDEAPEYSVSVTDQETASGKGDEIITGPVEATIDFTDTNDNPTLIGLAANPDTTPTLLAFDFTIHEGEISSIGLSQIDAADEVGETDQIDLTFMVAPPTGFTPANANEVAGGFFARTGDTATAITSFTWVEVNNGDIVFKHDGSNVAPSYILTVEDTDGGSSSETFTATLVEGNDEPVVTTNALALTEGEATTINPAILTVTDEESAPAELTYTVDTQSGGKFQVDNADKTTFTQADVIAGTVTFLDDGHDDAPPTFSLTLEDGGIADPAGPPGTFIDQETVTLTQADFAVTANYTSVNDVPTTNNGASTPDEFILLPFPGVTEGKSVDVTTAVINMSDEESVAAALVYFVDDAQNGSFQVNGANVSQFTQADIDGDLVTFLHDGSEAAPTFTLTLKDNNGGTGANSITQSVTPEFTLANEAPEFITNTLSPLEGQKVTLTADNLSASDREDAETLLKFSIDPADVTGGTFFLNGTALTATDTFSLVQINAGLVTFEDDGDETPPTYEVTVTDIEGLPTKEAAIIDLTTFQQNDNPTLDVNTFEFSEGEVLVLNQGTTENLVASDDETADPAQLTYTITNLEGGQFLINGLTETLEFTQKQLNDEAIAFRVSNDGTEPSFTITVTDADGGTITAAGNVTAFTVVNDPPIAVDDIGTGFSTDQNTTFTTADLTLNDDNEEGTPLTVTEINGGSGTTSKGALVTRTGNTVAYNPNGQFNNLAAGQSTTDTFSYTVTDSDPPGGKTDTGTVTITINGVNDNPITTDDLSYTANETDFIALNVLDNDSDIDDGDMLTITDVNTTGVIGTVTNIGTSLTYDASSGGGNLAAGATREENFTYTVSDGNGGTSIASVKIVVTGVNDDPIAIADGGAGSTGFETTDNQTFTTAVLIANDDDPDEDALTVTKINDATANPGSSFATANGGQVVLKSDGSVDYTPPAAFRALSVGDTQTDTFTYAVSDGSSESGNAIVTITINGANEAPVADDDPAFTTTEGTAIALDVLANDSDVDVADTLTISSVNTTGLTGTVTNNGTSLTYTPGQNLKGGETATETFTYNVSDGQGGTDTGTVSVVVTGLNDPPIATADNGTGFTTNEITPFTTSNVLSNDFDPEGAAISLVSVSTSGTRGLVTSNGNGTFTYDPNDKFDTVPVGRTATDTFTYTIQDDVGATASTTVSITVNGLLSSFFDYEQQLQSQNLGAAIPADQVGVFPLAQIFDEAYYLDRNPDVAALVGSVFSSGYQHFINFGLDEGRNPSVLYNERFYRNQNPDIAAAIADGFLTSGLRHFLNSGHQEGRDPSALFDQSDYLTNNPDVAAAVNNGTIASGFQHYVLSGIDEQRLPNRSLFSEGFYLANNPDVAAAGVDAFTHFISAGQFEGRRPSSIYSESSYLANNPDIVAAIGNGGFDSGFEHYQQFGRFEGRFVF